MALLSFTLAFFSKSARTKKISGAGACLFVLLICLLRFKELGVSFLKNDLLPVIATAVFLTIGYVVMEWWDKRHSENV